MRAMVLSVAVLLAGCTGGEAPPADPQVSDTTGAIRGVVVDPSILPLAGVTVELMGHDVERVTDENGEFLFEKLEPGLYVMVASAPGHLATQTSQDVVAGSSSSVKIMMPIDASPVPRPETVRFEGYIEAADAWATWILLEFTGNTDLCTCEFDASVGENAHTAILEAFWTPSSQANDEEMWIELYPPEDGYHGEYFESPVNWRHDATEWEAGDARLVFSVGTTIAIEQEFEVFFTVWYDGPAPDGWSVQDG